MKKIILIVTLIGLTTISCVDVDVDDCYKCELISIDGRISTTEYLPCSTDIEHYKDWLYDRGKVSVVKCTEL